MDVNILWITAAVSAEIIGIALFLKKIRNKALLKYRAVFAIFAGIIVVLQIFTIVSMLIMEGVFEPSSPLIENSSIQDPSSAAVLPLLRKQDFPGNWEWVNISMQQPSKWPWKDSPVDSAESILIAKVSHLLIFKHYVRVFHWDALYSSPISEKEFLQRISTGEDETSFIPKLNKAGKYFYTICRKGSDFYICDVFVGYENLISFISVVTPQDFGEQFTIDLLNSSVEIVDQRLK